MALKVPEVLNAILQNTDRKGQAYCARTCKKWQSPALDFLWKDLESLEPLVRLLVPLLLVSIEIQNRTAEMYEWKRNGSFGDADWRTFDVYAKRVRSLEYDDSGASRPNPAMNAGIFADIGMYRPPGPFLPNVRTIHWRNISERRAPAVLMFVSGAPVLESLSISFGHAVPPRTTASLINTLSCRTPHLNHLSLSCGTSIQHRPIKMAFSRWLYQLRDLKAIGIPAYFGMTAVVQALASLPHLQTIHHTRNGYELDAEGMMWNFEEGFHVLKELSFDAPLSMAGQLICSPKLSHLTRICLNTRASAPELHVHLPDFFTQVATCFSLEHLQLMLRDDINATEETETQLLLSYKHLRPLLTCRGLKQLQIAYNLPMTLYAHQLEEMGGKWPEMVTLELCQNPRISLEPFLESPGTSISVLPTVVASFRKLESFGIFLSPKAEFADSDRLGSSELKRLHFGHSQVPRTGDSFAAGAYIALLCSRITEVTTGKVAWFPSIDDSTEWNPEILKRRTEWDRVRDVINATLKLRRIFNETIVVLSQKLSDAEAKLRDCQHQLNVLDYPA
ncbi:hypothetical protein FRB96_000085 [Tulasnella sp. 330]|nr:hypothetical protein FRB96_000085 [Tulasnella sp. 330]